MSEMTIADKILRAKEDFDDVRASGFAQGYTDGRLDGYQEGYDAGQAAGGGDTDAAYEQGVADGRASLKLAASWGSMFYQRDYRTEYPQGVDLILEYGEYFTGAIGSMCRYSQGIKSVKIIGNKDVVLNVSGAFANCYSLEAVDLTECSTSFTNIQNPFHGSSELKTIKGELNFTAGATVVTPFHGCYALEDVRFVAGCIENNTSFAHSPLNKPSIESAMAGLSDTATGMTASFKKTAVNTAFETSEGAADGSTSEEWLALVATKPNWTITLA